MAETTNAKHELSRLRNCMASCLVGLAKSSRKLSSTG